MCWRARRVYRLNQDWVEVEAGDFMWLRAFCPQACYAGGPGKFRYLLYKDVNRHAKLGGVASGRATMEPHRRAAADPRERLRRSAMSSIRVATTHYPINGGKCRALPRISPRAEAGGPNAPRADLDRCTARPTNCRCKLTMVERHPFGSQAFVPLSPRPFLVVVCA